MYCNITYIGSLAWNIQTCKIMGCVSARLRNLNTISSLGGPELEDSAPGDSELAQEPGLELGPALEPVGSELAWGPGLELEPAPELGHGPQ